MLKTHPALRPGRLARTAPILVVALAAVAAAPSADAAPKLRTAQFKVAVEATQTTSWKLVPPATPRDCTPQVTTEGQGREVVTLHTTRAANARVTAIGGQAMFTIHGRDVASAPDSRAATKREATVRSRTVPGSCGDNREEAVDRGATDCGALSRGLVLQLTYERGRLSVGSAEDLLAPLSQQTFAACDAYAANGVELNAITPVSTRLPLRDLLDPAQRKHVVLGARTWKLRSGSVTGSTTVRWTTTITRRGR